jgi:hypothetical protein
VITVRQLAWAAFTVAAVSAGCSTSLREIRARDPEFRFAGVPTSRHFAVSRCIRDVLEQGGVDSVAYEIVQEPDGSPTGLDHLRIPFEGVALAA